MSSCLSLGSLMLRNAIRTAHKCANVTGEPRSVVYDTSDPDGPYCVCAGYDLDGFYAGLNPIYCTLEGD